MNFGREKIKKNPKVISSLGWWINIHVYTYTSLKVESPASSPSRISGAVHLIGKRPWKKTTNNCLPYKAYVHFLSKPSLTRCEATLRKHDKIWRESYICRSLISQSNVSLLKNVTENRKRNSFHETFYKKRMWNWQSRCPGQSTDSVNFYLFFVLLISCK